MGEYERSVSVSASADAAFRFLSDPSNLSRYVATMVRAEPRGSDQVHVAAEVRARHEEGDARLRVDAEDRRMEWTGAGESDYRGWLRVAPSGDGSAVTIHIHAVRDEDQDEIERALDETAANVERLLAAR